MKEGPKERERDTHIIDRDTSSEHSAGHHCTLTSDREAVIHREDEWSLGISLWNENLLTQHFYQLVNS